MKLGIRRPVRRLAAVVAPIVALFLLPCGHAAASVPQDWRATSVASFDEVWQTINDTFYDPSFGGLDWAAVKTELRPRVLSAASPDEARAVMREMLARLKKSHFVILSPDSADALPGAATVPAEIRVTPEGVLITKVMDAAAARAGLAAGQMLMSIDGIAAADLVRRAEGPDARSMNLDAWRRVNQVLHGDDGSLASLRVTGPDEPPREIKITRTLGAGETVTLGNLPPLRVAFESREVTTPAGRRAGFIGFTVWMTAIGQPFERAVDQFRASDGLVIDLRGNPGGLAGMMGGISGHLIANPVLLGTMRTREAQLKFNVNPRLVTWDARRVAPFAGPVAILVDELTGSTSETFAGSLQSLGRARIFGRPTMGQALPALTKTLPNGDVLLHAIGDFVTSTGRSLEGDGVIPDETVLLSARSLASGRDAVLDAALRWFDTVKRGG